MKKPVRWLRKYLCNMEFFLPFNIAPFPFSISYKDKILLTGSCFSEGIGNQLKEFKFPVLQNPNGILYDPVSIADALLSYIQNKQYAEENIFEMNGLWHSWKHHSVFSGIHKKEVLHKINVTQNEAHTFLKEAKLLFITFGTAFNYQLNDTKEYVANCHKAPASLFIKKLLPVHEIITYILKAITALEYFNPGLKIIFTISPVKHVKDGVVQNNQSKARLIEAVHAITEQKENAFYFPSYELVTDILRDYRFYKSDLVHPNSMAVNFVFDSFRESLLDNSSKKIMDEIRKVTSAVNHQPFEKKSAAYQKFIDVQLEKINTIEKKYPFIHLVHEKQYFEDNRSKD